MEGLQINVLISTIDTGIDKIKNIVLSQRTDVRYIVSHQFTEKNYKYIPNELLRDDISIYHMEGKGLTKSRNNAIKHALGNICIIADDDVRYTNEFFNTILINFKNSDTDVALFKIRTLPGEDEYKNYPVEHYELSIKKMHSLSSIEIAFKLDSVKNRITFDERFGLGSKMIGGEELLFIRDAIKAGLKVMYYPEFVVIHSKNSTIKALPKYHEYRNKSGGAIDARIYGWVSLPRTIIIFLLKLPDIIRYNKNPFSYLVERLSGGLYILTSLRK